MHVWRWLRARKRETGGTGELIKAIVLLIISGISFFKPGILLSFLPFVTGALLILDGLAKAPFIKKCGIGETNGDG